MDQGGRRKTCRQQKTPDFSGVLDFLGCPRRVHLVRPEGFEPPTNGFGSHYSIRLSYERLAAHYARTAGVRVMGLGDTRPGQPLRHSRCDDTGLSARAVAGRHRTPRFKRTGSRRAAVWPSQAAVAEAACSTSHLTVSLGTRLSAVTAEPAWQPHHLPQPTRANARPWPLATLIAAASRTP